jgi:hypothetical protein
MKTFRLILALMLCLTVPTAGWASVVSGPLCPTLHHHHEAPEHTAHHSHADNHAQGCDDDLAGGPCKGEHCGCGCGAGACSSSAMPLLAMSNTSLLHLADKGQLPPDNQPAPVTARGSSPLRPPIA